MKGLFPCRRFSGFGPAGFSPSHRPPVPCEIQAGTSAGLRNLVRQQCPRRPGVYGMLDASGELIYVGKAKCLRTRLLSYFRPRSRDPKAGRILKRTATIVWEFAPSEFAALLRELELIHRWRPRFNVQGQPGRRRRTYVCLGRRPAPHAFLAGRPPAGAQASFGPLPAGGRAREAVRRLNDWFKLRDCPRSQEMVFADQAELFPVLRAAGCIRHEIGTCLGPCAGACSRPAYGEQVRAARIFLEGKDPAPVETLERDMQAAAVAQQFERAALLRDRLQSLRWLQDQLGRLRSARESLSFVYPVRGHGGKTHWYLIRCGHVAAVLPAPRGRANCQAVAQKIDAVFHGTQAWIGAPPSDVTDSVLLVAAWFRRHPDERAHALAPATALQACQNGMIPAGESAGPNDVT